MLNISLKEVGVIIDIIYTYILMYIYISKVVKGYENKHIVKTEIKS